MPKRKKSSEDYEHLLKKMKKLERKILRASRRSSDSCSPTMSDVGESNPQDGDIFDITPLTDEEPLAVDEPLRLEPIPSTSAAANAADATALAAVHAASEIENVLDSDNQNAVPSQTLPPLDDEILAILGNDPSVQKSYGEDIHKDLAVRLEHIATTGLTKEIRKELQSKYLPPANSTLVDAPALNPEIKAAVSETVAKRDKGIEIKQKQVANAISCIGQATTQLLSHNEKNPTLLKLLMDANRILCDCQYLDSLTRKNFILATLKKDLKDQLQTTKIDKMLFGNNFAETLKTAKAFPFHEFKLEGASPERQASGDTEDSAACLSEESSRAILENVAATSNSGPPPSINLVKYAAIAPCITRLPWLQAYYQGIVDKEMRPAFILIIVGQ